MQDPAVAATFQQAQQDPAVAQYLREQQAAQVGGAAAPPPPAPAPAPAAQALDPGLADPAFQQAMKDPAVADYLKAQAAAQQAAQSGAAAIPTGQGNIKVPDGVKPTGEVGLNQNGGSHDGDTYFTGVGPDGITYHYYKDGSKVRMTPRDGAASIGAQVGAAASSGQPAQTFQQAVQDPAVAATFQQAQQDPAVAQYLREQQAIKAGGAAAPAAPSGSDGGSGGGTMGPYMIDPNLPRNVDLADSLKDGNVSLMGGHTQVKTPKGATIIMPKDVSPDAQMLMNTDYGDPHFGEYYLTSTGKDGKVTKYYAVDNDINSGKAFENISGGAISSDVAKAAQHAGGVAGAQLASQQDNNGGGYAGSYSSSSGSSGGYTSPAPVSQSSGSGGGGNDDGDAGGSKKPKKMTPTEQYIESTQDYKHNYGDAPMTGYSQSPSDKAYELDKSNNSSKHDSISPPGSHDKRPTSGGMHDSIPEPGINKTASAGQSAADYSDWGKHKYDESNKAGMFPTSSSYPPAEKTAGMQVATNEAGGWASENTGSDPANSAMGSIAAVDTNPLNIKDNKGS
jgi:hypothetical protein